MTDLWTTLYDYLYVVFVDHFDAWAYFGILAQVVFGLRFITQWIASERQGRSVIPMSFWMLSIVGSLMLLVYALIRRDPVYILGQGPNVLIYVRNVMLVRRERAQQAAKPSP
ncbi:lipid-A-disaccharide synthase N-terminal domain-containing protein [Methylovirgula sp. 4M-Z18]|uniref:lipid-A-disaccharide synthase N-terminal domain-containing protein n=1 Tax=Methylovirgula sp. 4M-Z18 TaxID=2293567 RepID=UPI000E2FB388|nr:lipid-A-disaccharide synthase N-terminal domain-containing protein [Methylovirgula sp. 4M-Z18]RFB80590.1 hypothetical protein DYH55_03545 [Methylovirgula sp. 4M-Z18]